MRRADHRPHGPVGRARPVTHALIPILNTNPTRVGLKIRVEAVILNECMSPTESAAMPHLRRQVETASIRPGRAARPNRPRVGTYS